MSNSPCSTARDRGWVERFQAGDSRAFDLIVEEYAPFVARIVNRLGVRTSDVADVTQDVFVDALSGLSGFRGESSLRTWLVTLTVRRTRKFIRWRWVRRMWLGGGELSPDSSPSNDEPTDGQILANERVDALRKAIDALPTGYREVIVLRYLEELEVSQIAETLNLSRAAIDMRLSRARDLLRDQLSEWKE